MRSVFRPLVERRTYRELLFLLSAAPLAAAWFGLLLAGWLATSLLALTPLVVPVLAAFRTATWLAAVAEAAIVRGLLGVDVRVPAPARGHGYWGRIRAGLSDPHFWSQQAYLLLRTVVGGALAVAVTSLAAASLWLIGLPLTYRVVHQDAFGTHVHTLPVALAFVPAGCAGVLLCVHVVRALASPWGRLARVLLVERPAPQAPSTPMQGLLRRALRPHLGFYVGLNLLLVVIWALTTRAYFWPEWTLLPLGMPLAVHGWTAFVDRVGARRIARTRALAIDLGASTTLFLFLVGVWALTTRAYFWPVWPGLGLAVVVGLHALAAMTRRIDVLTTTRAGVVEAAESELRRIERDLHDGAQARLVALGMSLGLAEQKLGDDPEAARALLTEARVGAVEALRELRDLARGIHPPILVDRGLEAALAALVTRVPLPVDVAVDLPERPPEAVESAAYFVAAEALANAAKHSGASRVQVRVAARAGETLTVTVADDGRGGADSDGAGLSGLRSRVEALDGALRVDSPAGGPTTVEAVLPCGS
jgi:signal transduction histidine kinase